MECMNKGFIGEFLKSLLSIQAFSATVPLFFISPAQRLSSIRAFKLLSVQACEFAGAELHNSSAMNTLRIF